MARPHPLSRSTVLGDESQPPAKRSKSSADGLALAPRIQPASNPTPAGKPALLTLTPRQASDVFQRLISSALQEAGFDGAEADVLWAVEEQLLSAANRLLASVKERSELGRRTQPSQADLQQAFVEEGWETKQMGRRKDWLLSQPIAPTDLFAILPPTSEHQPEFLPSDDEAPVAPRATTSSSKKLSKQVPPLPYAPSHLPALPPRHAYLSTQPPPPPPRPKDAPAEIPLLEERYAQTRTVEGALVRLIDKTTHAGAPGSLEEGLRDLGLGLVGWRTKERAGLGGASGKRSRGGK